MMSAGIDVSVSVTTDGGGAIVISRNTTRIATACMATDTPIAPPNRRCRVSSRKPADNGPSGRIDPLPRPLPGGVGEAGAGPTGDADIVGLVCWEVMNAVKTRQRLRRGSIVLDPNRPRWIHFDRACTLLQLQ